MNLAIATHLPVLGPGGVEVLVRALVRGLSEDHRITLASTDTPEAIEESELAGHVDSFIQISANCPSGPWGAGLGGELKRRQVEMCHFHLGGTYCWQSGSWRLSPIPKVRSVGIRCVSINHQAVSPFDVSRRDQPLWRRLGGYLRQYPGKSHQLAAVEHEVLVSRHDECLSRRCFPFQSGKFMTLYHSQLDAGVRAVPLPESRILMNLGTICFRKGQDLLVDAFAGIAGDFPDWRLRLVGRLAERACADRISKLIEQYGLEDRVEMVGPTDRPIEQLCQAEAYVQPSLLEGLGLSLQEAMFLGRPAIGSRVGGIPELIDQGTTGILVPPGDVAALSEGLREILGCRVKRESFAAAGASSIRKQGMTRQAMLERYRELLRSS